MAKRNNTERNNNKRKTKSAQQAGEQKRDSERQRERALLLFTHATNGIWNATWSTTKNSICNALSTDFFVLCFTSFNFAFALPFHTAQLKQIIMRNYWSSNADTTRVQNTTAANCGLTSRECKRAAAWLERVCKKEREGERTRLSANVAAARRMRAIFRESQREKESFKTCTVSTKSLTRLLIMANWQGK